MDTHPKTPTRTPPSKIKEKDKQTPSTTLAIQLELYIKNRAAYVKNRKGVAQKEVDLAEAIRHAEERYRDSLRDAGMIEYRVTTTAAAADNGNADRMNNEAHEALASVSMAASKLDALVTLRGKVCSSNVKAARAAILELAARVNGTKRVRSLPAMPAYADETIVLLPASMLVD